MTTTDADLFGARDRLRKARENQQRAAALLREQAQSMAAECTAMREAENETRAAELSLISVADGREPEAALPARRSDPNGVLTVLNFSEYATA